jgi:cytochrome P450
MSSQRERPPVVGTLAEYSEAPFERRTEWAKEADIFRVTGPEADHHMAVHPDYVGEILFDDEQFVKFEGYGSVFGDGVVSVYGDQWRAQRGALQPAFIPPQVRSYAETIREIVAEVVAGIEDGETVDVRELFTDLTMEVMLETLFGGSEKKKGTISEAAHGITEWFLETATAGDVPPEVESGFEEGMNQLTTLIDEMITERGEGDEDGDLLSMLVALGTESEADYTDERIRDEMITMLFAAHETTALTLTYTLFLLADAPKVEEKLLEEVDEVLDGSVAGPEHLTELEYTEQVLNEALRLYCPAHSLFRETTTDVEIDGYMIPEGDVVHLPQWVIHRDERWWDDPTEFRPERFTGETDRPSHTFFPFGVGPRRCLGEDFARAEAKIVISTFIDRFTFERETEDFEMLASLTAVPDRPIELTPHRRNVDTSDS